MKLLKGYYSYLAVSGGLLLGLAAQNNWALQMLAFALVSAGALSVQNASRWYMRASIASLVEEGRPLPVDVKDAAIFHAGPIIRPLEDDKFEMVSVGPTTSMRMEKFEYEFVQKSGVRVIVGKGGMGPNTERACKEFGAIHCVFPAGNAVVAATEVEEIVEAQWRDLGMPETLWHCHVNEFGPLIVSIDAEGRNLFEENKVIFNERKEKAIEEICKHVGFIK